MPWFPDFVGAAQLARARTRDDGRHHLRPPILPDGAIEPGDVVGRLQRALEAGDTDDGVRCAVEYNCDRWDGREVPPQAGIGVFECGRGGLLEAVRIYDDVER